MSSEPPLTDDGQSLPRVLGPVTALCVIVGSVIGSGIFIVPARIATAVPSMSGIVLVWVLGGLLSLAGALSVAELGAMLPHAGGSYVYLREAYGPMPAFLFGWCEFLVVRAGSIATLASAFALYFNQVVPAPAGLAPELWQMLAAVGAIAFLATINAVGTQLGGGVQVLGTALKVGALGLMIVLPFLLGQASAARLTPVWPRALGLGLFQGVMLALVAALWAYDGWINSTALAEEIHDPARNIPRSLILGMLILIAIYVGMGLVYHMVLTMPEVQSAAKVGGSPRVVAAEFCRRLVGQRGVVAISVVVMCSTFISINGNCLSGPRAYFAMARDGLFFQGLCRVSRRFRTPANAIITQGLWAIFLTIAGTAMILVAPPSTGLPGPVLSAWRKLHETPLYDVLYTYALFGATLFYTLAITSVIVLRYRRPELHRPYRTFGYPATPLLYLVGALVLLGSMIIQTPFESVSGLALIGLGIPVYWYFARRSGAAARAMKPVGEQPTV